MEIALTAPPAEPRLVRPAGDSQLNTILILFLVLRFSLLFLYSPQGVLTDYTDYSYYFRITQLSEKGYFPFINMWSEYPPLTAYAPQIAYWITERVMPVGDVGGYGYDIYSRVLGGLLLIFDSGSLILLHRIAARAWGVQKADWLAWVFASLSLPLYFWSYAHQGIPVFFMLLALYAFCTGQFAGSAVAVGLGVAAKITPVFLLGPAVKFLWPHWRKAVGYGLLAILTVLAVFLPFYLLGGGPWIAASFTSLLKHDAWSTIWAIMDNVWQASGVGPASSHLSLEQAGAAATHPTLIPSWVTLGIFAVGYAVFFFRPIRKAGMQHYIWFSTLTAMGLHLWSSYWSPQWAAALVPLFLLSFPDGLGVGLTLSLTAAAFMEWPVAGVFHSQPLLVAAILIRTALFIGVGVLTVRRLWFASAEQ